MGRRSRQVWKRRVARRRVMSRLEFQMYVASFRQWWRVLAGR